ncbi:unnamed protein product [Peronospora belbahrii]|uniref:Uncharacterized protein n=1 Tax=Peronospora belbahrii TaxID=622444 RepID=A0ABN8D442_9STRA|nr:unnamed protein product [Peronospora belbahrii]
MNELDATSEKCGMLKEILLGLVDKHAGLERRCMELEEQTSRETLALKSKEQQLNEARNTLDLLREDICSTQWNLEYDQAELAKEEKRLNIISQSGQHEAATVEKVDATLRCEKNAVEDLHRSWQNYEGMIHEEHRQLVIENENAISEQQKLQMLLGSNGATCPADEEVVQSANDLKLQLQHVNEEVTSAKFFRRELALRKKQEKEWLAFTHSSIKAKDEQLNWLECQRVHLENEQNEAKKVYAAEEATYQTFLREHKAAVDSCENQIRDAERQLKTTERAIPARKKKITAINKKIAEKAKVLAEWKTKISTNQAQASKSAATKELVHAEMLAIQNALEQACLSVQRTKQLRTTQEMETEELRSSCAVLESEIQQLHKTLATLKDDIAAAQTAVKNRVDEIRDKFLSTFVVEDAGNLIELLNKEIANWTTKDTDGAISNAFAIQIKVLQQRYDDLSANTRKRYDKILLQKERQYNTKLKMLNTKAAEKKQKLAVVSLISNNQLTGNKAVVKNSVCKEALSATGHKSEVDPYSVEITPSEDDTNETEKNKFDPFRKEHTNSDGTNSEVPAQSSSKLAQKTTKEVQKLAPKSVRRQLAPGLNLVDQSPQTDKELTDNFATNSIAVVAATKATDPSGLTVLTQRRQSSDNGARQSRLKRRTPAQKAGNPPAKTASITPEAALPASIADSMSTCAQPNPAVELSSQSSVYSPIGCDDDHEALQFTRDAGDADVTKQMSNTAVLFSASQAAAKKPQLKKVGQHSKITAKRRTSTKVTHLSRPKVKKVNRVSIGRSQANVRTVDWSATDSFTFD